jgi:hypothetical protein
MKAKKTIAGMDRNPVLLAMGRPRHKERGPQDGNEIEDWIFRESPGIMTLVTFKILILFKCDRPVVKVVVCLNNLRPMPARFAGEIARNNFGHILHVFPYRFIPLVGIDFRVRFALGAIVGWDRRTDQRPERVDMRGRLWTERRLHGAAPLVADDHDELRAEMTGIDSVLDAAQYAACSNITGLPNDEQVAHPQIEDYLGRNSGI